MWLIPAALNHCPERCDVQAPAPLVGQAAPHLAPDRDRIVDAGEGTVVHIAGDVVEGAVDHGRRCPTAGSATAEPVNSDQPT